MGTRRRACQLRVSERGGYHYNVADMSGGHIIMVLLGEGEGAL